MNIVVNDALQAFIDPLTPQEYEALERSILTEGCRDALVLWGDMLVDGHNRYRICLQHGLPFETRQSTLFQSLEDVQLWMIDQHLGRRSVSDFQRGVLALRKREIVAERRARMLVASPASESREGDSDHIAPWEETPEGDVALPGAAAPAMAPVPEALKSREDLARAARLSSSQVVLIEKIHKQATPEVVAAVKSGVISINAAAAMASLPAQEQVAAALAGKEELKQAAKRVREAKRKPRESAKSEALGTAAANAVEAVSESALLQRIAELTAENSALREQVAQLQAQLV